MKAITLAGGLTDRKESPCFPLPVSFFPVSYALLHSQGHTHHAGLSWPCELEQVTARELLPV